MFFCRTLPRLAVGAVALAGAFFIFHPAVAQNPSPKNPGVEIVGRLSENRYLTPTGQLLTPVGRQTQLPEMRPQAIALSPDGKLIATSGKTNYLVLVDPDSGEVLQKVRMPGNEVPAIEENEIDEEESSKLDLDKSATMSFTGLNFSPDGSRIYLSNAGGDVKVFAVDAERKAAALGSLPVPEARTSKRKKEIPTGLVVSADGKRLYVAGNLANKLHEIDVETGKTLRSWDTGVAPFDVVLVKGKAYVSNSGGPRPKRGDVTAPAGSGTIVQVDPVRFIANKGSVTVIDLAGNRVEAEVPAEMHASALAVSPNEKFVVVANTGSDTLTVIDTSTDRPVEKIWARLTPADLFGAQPNALCFDRSGKLLFVCNGTQNAVAVIKFDPKDNESKVAGFLPVGWFPGAIRYDEGRNAIHVANIKGIGAKKDFKPGEQVKLGSKQFWGTLSLIPLPNADELKAMTAIAMVNMRYEKLAEAKLPPRPNQAPQPVPERVGEPSVFRHVLYIIKENRTYDQILGDMKEGNGDAKLCTFGEKYTPNQHKIAREFVLLDNTYCSGVQSADGHQWTDSAITNAYMERQVGAGFPRSYPGGKKDEDALAWASSGFIWDNALAHGKTFRNYGEWMLSEAGWTDKSKKDKAGWLDFWDDFQNHTGKTKLASRPAIESLRAHSKLDTVGWDLNVTDVARAAKFIEELRQFEARGTMPNLMILFLPNDHTGGTRGKGPKPGSQIADNDLALGRVVEAVSHSKFWPETCIFAIEDDPQAGWDHVSGYRTTCYIASPYTKRGQTISTQYNQTSLMRTIELIVGVPPMNQLDATATPMFDCFTTTPDLTPFQSVENTVSLAAMNPEPEAIADAQLRADAIASAKLPLDEADKCPEDALNQILWRAMKGTSVPYPLWAVKADDDDD
ncbi:MAG: bifunctional YncE family protein/alkaline phosphatase family protein [Chthoniobacteraceae bacterium]